MAKTNPINVRLDHETRDALTRAAEAAGVSLSAMVDKATSQWLRAHGWFDGDMKPVEKDWVKKPEIVGEPKKKAPKFGTPEYYAYRRGQ